VIREQCDAALLTAAAAGAVATALRPYGIKRHSASADFGPSCQVYQRLRFTCDEIRMRPSLFASRAQDGNVARKICKQPTEAQERRLRSSCGRADAP
jgi:hypothetical protein